MFAHCSLRSLILATLFCGVLAGCSKQPESTAQLDQQQEAPRAEFDLAMEATPIESLQPVPRTDQLQNESLAPQQQQQLEIARTQSMSRQSRARQSQAVQSRAPEAAAFSAPPQAMSLDVQAMQPQAAPSQAMQPQAAGGAQRADLLSQFPAGASRTGEGFATVQVFYATDRSRDPLPLSSYQVTGQKQVFTASACGAVLMIFVGALFWLTGRKRMATTTAMFGLITGIMAALIVTMGKANIEKHGVTYAGDRGTLVRGVCQVTVPDSHQRGMVERPSLLRFEFKEDQRKHIVLTSAVELATNDFHERLSDTVRKSPEADLLVFIHGYNVDFESAVQRTAQMAVDLPFEGVPVCYSWPSQASLVGYPIDETNAAWTTTHLRDFLLELCDKSGARSVNVVAHSMGNRPMTAAMEQIRWQRDEELDTPFDRIVLAAPDVDADRFRRDLAPSLLEVADHVTLYASSDDQALIASKQVHGYPRAGESGPHIVVVPGVETIDVSGIDLSLLGHSYYGDNESMLRDLYEVVRARLPAPRRAMLIPLQQGDLPYWQLAQRPTQQF